MRINYNCKHHSNSECTCDFLAKFERKLRKGVKSTVVNIQCNETLFPSIDVVDLIVRYIPNINHLILRGVDYYDLPELSEKFQLLNLTRLKLLCYRHQPYCYEDDTIFPDVDDLILPPTLISFKFQYYDDPCSSHPIYTTKHIFKYPPTLQTLHLFKMRWPLNIEQMSNLTNLELSSFCSYNHQIKFPQSLKKLTISGINRLDVAHNDKHNYDIPSRCKLIIKIDASDKSCYESESGSDLESDGELNDFQRERRKLKRECKDDYLDEFKNDRQNLSVLAPFTGQVHTLHLSTQLAFKIVPSIIKDCSQLQVLVINIRGKFKEDVWDAIKNHPSLRVLIVMISTRNENEYLKYLQTLQLVLLNTSVKLYIIHNWYTPTSVEQIKETIDCKVIKKMFGYY